MRTWLHGQRLNSITLVQDKALDKKQLAISDKLYFAEKLLDLGSFVCFKSFIWDSIKCNLF
jgi:hypothetical protein